jgi:hypothetical protein
VRIERAFSRRDADAGHATFFGAILGCDSEDPTTWTKPVILFGLYNEELFARAANTDPAGATKKPTPGTDPKSAPREKGSTGGV